jgi:hypothetical protein
MFIKLVLLCRSRGSCFKLNNISQGFVRQDNRRGT